MDLFGSIKDKIPAQAKDFLEGQGKDQIIKFIMDKVKEGKQSEANELVNDTMAKHEDGKLDSNGVQGFVQKIQSFVKPEYVEQVKNFAMQFLNKGK